MIVPKREELEALRLELDLLIRKVYDDYADINYRHSNTFKTSVMKYNELKLKLEELISEPAERIINGDVFDMPYGKYRCPNCGGFVIREPDK